MLCRQLQLWPRDTYTTRTMARRRRTRTASALVVVLSAAGGGRFDMKRSGTPAAMGFLLAVPSRPATASKRFTAVRARSSGCGSDGSNSRSGSHLMIFLSDGCRVDDRRHQRQIKGVTNVSGDRGYASLFKGRPCLPDRRWSHLVPPRSRTVGRARAVSARATRTPTVEEMDREWDAILESDDDDEEDGEEDAEDYEMGDDVDDVAGIMSTDDLLATDASFGGDLDGFADVDGSRPRKRVWYASYRERKRAEASREAEKQERLRKLPKHHVEYLEEMQRNREVAAARREKYTKKFFRQKKLHDIIKDRGRRAVREATWATRWPRNVTRGLEDLQVGDWIEGKVRNVESYGAWVDVNAERDGLLHVRDMDEIFTPSAEQRFRTKDKVRVRVKFVDPAVGKLGLSLIEDGPREGDLPPPPPRPRISVADVSPGDQLWGHVERVTNMGAYVNVGAEVPGFLLLKEVPGRPKGVTAPQVLRRNKRLRVYAKEVDKEGLRIKLTCKRPRSRPRCGPAPALASDAIYNEFTYDDTKTRVRDGEAGPNEEERANWWDDEGDDGIDEDDDEGDEDNEEEDEWFFPTRGEVIPPPDGA